MSCLRCSKLDMQLPALNSWHHIHAISHEVAGQMTDLTLVRAARQATHQVKMCNPAPMKEGQPSSHIQSNAQAPVMHSMHMVSSTSCI